MNHTNLPSIIKNAIHLFKFVLMFSNNRNLAKFLDDFLFNAINGFQWNSFPAFNIIISIPLKKEYNHLKSIFDKWLGNQVSRNMMDYFLQRFL